MPVVPSSTFLVANLKELEVSGSIKLGNKTITKLLDSADVSSISGSGGGGLDSASVVNLIDSAYVQARQTTYTTADFTDSAFVTGLPVSTFTNDTNYLDSTTVQGVIDASYIQSNQTTYTNANFADSAFVTTQINNLIDGAPGTLDTLNEIAAALNDDDSAYNTLVTLIGTKTDFDSADAITLIDSSYIQARQITYDFLDSSEAIALIDSAYVQSRQITYDFLDSSEVISLIDSAYVQARQTSGGGGTFDSAAAIELIDSAYVQARQTSGGTTNAYVEATSSITALVNKKYIVDTSSAITITLPAVPSFGDEVKIIDGTNNAGTNNITINRNSNKILGADSDFIIDVNRTAVDLVYYNATQGWIISGNT